MGDLRESMLRYIHARPCHRGAWQWASEQLGVQDEMNPPLSWDNAPVDDKPTAPSPVTQGEHAFWDAGDMGCGDLVLELRARLNEMSARQVLRLRATDLGAPQDIPAWCGMTGNKLIRQQSDQYWIQLKD